MALLAVLLGCGNPLVRDIVGEKDDRPATIDPGPAAPGPDEPPVTDPDDPPVTDPDEPPVTNPVNPPVINATTPFIVTHPIGGLYPQNSTAAALSVTAVSTDSGVLSYQWYSNTVDSTAGGTLITGADAASYIPPTGTGGVSYYFVVVTNTNNGASGTKTATITSTTAAVTVTTVETDAAAFKSDYAAILAKTTITVATGDETAVEAALAAYDLLTAAAKALVSAEKTLLDALKAQITVLKSGTTAISITNGHMIDETFTLAGQTLYRLNPAATRRVSFTLENGYTAIRWSVGAAELTWANGATSFTFDAADWPAGTYVLGLTVEKNGKSWSKNVTIIVANGAGA
jgi:hypothetical protein